MSASEAKFDVPIRVVAASFGAAYANIGTLKDSFVVMILNSLDAEIVLSLDGSNPWIYLGPAEPLIMNYHAANKIFMATSIWAKYVNGAPTTGSLRIHNVKRAPL